MLTRKLIEISMKVEDYLYIHKPMSVGAAEMYLQQIAACKLQCSNTDLPALQVIEKLTRQMKTIISEQHANACDNDVTEYKPEYCPSPVYSLPDEDKTQYYQDIASEVDFEIIDLCDDDEVMEVCVDVEEHRALEPMSTPATNTVLSQVTNNVACSQSILDNFEPNTTNILVDTSNGQVSDSQTDMNILKGFTFTPPKEQPFRVVSKLDVVINKAIIPKVISEKNTTSSNCNVPKANNKSSNIAPAKINDENKIVKQNNNPHTKAYCSNISANITKQDKKNTAKENVTKMKRKPRKKKVPKDLKNNKLETTQINTNPKVNIDLQNKKAENNKFVSDILGTSIRDLNKESFVNKQFAENSTYVENTFDSSMRNLNKKVSIYNTNTDNDLSWLENIRYVREISDEEYDPNFKVPANFWENCTFPSFWSDLEFSII